MSEMVERVARALVDEARKVGIGDGMVRPFWLNMARAAIEATREPTAEMVADYADTMQEWFGNERLMVTDVWTKMINAALK